MASAKNSRNKPKLSRGRAPSRSHADDASTVYRAVHAPDVEHLRAEIDAAVDEGRRLRESIEARIAASDVAL